MWLPFHSISSGCGIRGHHVALSVWALMPNGHSSWQTPTALALTLSQQPGSL